VPDDRGVSTSETNAADPVLGVGPALAAPRPPTAGPGTAPGARPIGPSPRLPAADDRVDAASDVGATTASERMRSALGPLLAGGIVGLFLLWTPAAVLGGSWRESVGPGVDGMWPALGGVPWAALMVVAGVSVVIGVVVAARSGRRGVALLLVCWPFLTVPLTGTFVWGWGIGLMAVAAAQVRQGWRRVALPYLLLVLLAAWYCFSGVPAMLPVGLVDSGAHGDLAAAAFTFALYVLAITALLGWSVALAATRAARARTREAAVEARRAQLESAVTAERARLARDLHDVVAHHISLIAVRAEAAPYLDPDLDPRARGVLAAVAVDAREALDELRQVLTVLRRAQGDGGAADAERAPQPGAGDVTALVAAARDAGQQIVVLGRWPGPGEGEMPAAEGYVLYRVVQEALTNARRHAPGQAVTVTLLDGTAGALGADEGRRRGVRVQNPLDEVPPGPVVPGRGLAGMRERVESLGGTLDVVRSSDGFAVRALLPGSPA
jgi:signal transduction histidine kinase